MFCKNCGKSIVDGTMQCPFCGQNCSEVVQPAMSIKTHLTEAILVTLFCCLPFGIIAIVNASKVSGLAAAGKINEAMEASNNAKKWALIGLILGFVINVLVFLVNVAGAIFAE